MEKRKNILVLAYMVSPYRGSEYSVAWNYITNISEYNNLTVLYGTSGNHLGDNTDLEEYLRTNSVPNVDFIFVKPDKMAMALNWLNTHDILRYTFYLAYNAWHKQVYRIAKRIVDTQNIDLIHYLGPIGYREPGYLWKLNRPYMWGPIAGTGNYPYVLRKCLSMKSFIKYQTKSIINDFQLKHSKRLKRALSACDVLLTATTEAQDKFMRIHNRPSVYLPENGIVAANSLDSIADKFRGGVIELVFIGRIDGLKNLGLLLAALTKIDDIGKLHLNIVGDGTERAKLEAYARMHGLSERLTWHGQQKREKVFEILDKSHLHVITSLQEGNATVVFEAMAHGVPTLTLDHCGMHDTICDDCGFKIPIVSYEQVVADITDTLQRCIDNPDILKTKAEETVKCAENYLWDKRKPVFLECYDEAIRKFDERHK